MAALQHCLGDVGSAQCPFASQFQHPSPINMDAHIRELGHHLPPSLVAGSTQFLQGMDELRIAIVYEITQDMNLALRDIGVNLHSRDKEKVEASRCFKRR